MRHDASFEDTMVEENKRLRSWKAEALEVIGGLQELGRELGLRLGTRITGPQAVEAAKDLRAKVARVEALIDKWDDDSLARHVHWSAVPELRAALAPETPEAGDA